MHVCVAGVVACQGNQRRKQLIVAQVGAAQLQAPLEVGDRLAILLAFHGRGKETPFQAYGHLAAVPIGAGCRAVELGKGLGQIVVGLG